MARAGIKASERADHTWRAGRALPALNPTHFLVDERSEAELIAYAGSLARQLVFDDGTGDDRSFAALLENDITFVLAEISIVDGASEYLTYSRLAVSEQKAKARADMERLHGWVGRLKGAEMDLVSDDYADEVLSHFYAVAQLELTGLLLSGDENARVLFNGQAFSENVDRLFDAAFRGADIERSNDTTRAIYSAVNRVTQALVNAAKSQLEHVLKVRHDHPPHIGLYLAFVRLLRQQQAHLNRFTERHLDHFYKDHLNLRPNEAMADTAHVWFEPVPEGAAQAIPEGTVLTAGVMPDGRSIEYATSEEVHLSLARVAHIRGLSIQRTPRGTVLAIQQAEHLETLPPPPPDDDGGGWRPFGPWRPDGPVPFADAQLGLMVSSPILELSDGKRQVIISLDIENPDILATAADQFSDRMFKHSVSIADGFYDVSATVDTTLTQVVFTLDLGVEVPPLAVPDGSAYRWPVWRMELVPGWAQFAYSLLSDLILADVRITVAVDDMRGIRVRNPEGPVDISKPFAPFGGVPLPGSSLTISAPEWRDRDLTLLEVKADWANLPQGGFQDYFQGYQAGIRNESFSASMSQLVENKWQRISPLPKLPDPDERLFPLFSDLRRASDDALPPEECALVTAARYQFEPHRQTPRLRTGPQQSLSIRRSLAIDTDGAVFRIVLEQPNAAFGHGLYPNLVAKASLAQAKELFRGILAKGLKAALKAIKKVLAPLKKAAAKVEAEVGDQPVIINPPFTPMLRDFRVGYHAQTRVAFADASSNGEVYRLESFGRVRRLQGARPLVEQVRSGGYMYIGITGLDLRNIRPLTLLFHVNENVAAARSVSARGLSSAIGWSYFSHTGWQRFPSDGILADETRGLIRSGIVKLMPQRYMAEDAGTPGVLWICAYADRDTARMGSIVSIHTHGVSAQRSSAVEPINGRWNLPAGAIKRIASKHIQVASIQQPFATRDGRGPESEVEFRVRVSERLRHKNRAVQPLDYEQLTLQQFPQVGDAKCLVAPDGGIILVVAPLRTDMNTRPRLSAGMLSDIAAYLRPVMPDAVTSFVVRNPSYDAVRVSAWIDADDSELDALLANLEVAAYKAIAPWLFDPSAPMAIGGSASRTDVGRVQRALAAVPRVRAVSGVSLVTFSVVEAGTSAITLRHQLRDTAAFRDQGQEGRELSVHASIQASAEWSVLTPVRGHRFRLLGTPMVGEAVVRQDLRVVSRDEAQDPERLRRIDHMERAGIGNLAVGSELVICRDPSEVTGARRRFAVSGRG